MAISPDNFLYCSVSLTIEDSLQTGWRRTTAWVGFNYPDGEKESPTFEVFVDTQTGGALPGNAPDGVWFLWFVEDNYEFGPGQYGATGSSYDPRIRSGYVWQSGASPPASYIVGGGAQPAINQSLLKAGTWRMVLTAGNAQGPSGDMSVVDTSGTSAQWHFDSDGNGAAGGLAGVQAQAGQTDCGMIRRTTNVASMELLKGGVGGNNWRYGEQLTQKVVLTPSGGGSGFIGTKQARLAVSTDQTGSTRAKTVDVAHVNGVLENVSVKVDTAFSLTPQTYYLQVGLNNNLGISSSTPTNQRPNLITSLGAPIGLANYQLSWTTFSSAGNGAGLVFLSRDQIRDNAVYTLASGISLTKPSDSQAGVDVYNDAARLNASRLFRRVADDGNEAHARPYVSAIIQDAYGNPIPSINVRVQVRLDGTSNNDNQQDKTTNANGLVEWDYLIARTNAAFNRFKKSGVDDPNSPPFTVTITDVVGANPTPILAIDSEYGGKTFDQASYPAYAKDIWVQGRVFSGASEPTDLAAQQFGVNSEGHIVNVWTGNAGQATDNTDGAPTGVGSRTKNLGTGSVRYKPSSEFDEGSGELHDVTRTVVRDVAGRPFDVSVNARRWQGRKGIWNITLQEEDTPKIDIGNNGRLQGNYGYPTAFDTIAAPQDPSVLRVWLGYHDQDLAPTDGDWDMDASGSVNSPVDETVTDGPPNVGWNTDEGMYGQFAQDINFIAVDPDLNWKVAPSKGVTHPTELIWFTAEMIRLLPSGARVNVTPDSAPNYFIARRDPNTGYVEEIQSGTMTSLVDGGNPSRSMWTTSFNPAGLIGTYEFMVSGYQSGSRPPDSGNVMVFNGAKNPNIDIVVDINNETDSKGHLNPNDQFAVKAFGINDLTAALVTLDSSPAPAVALVRENSGAIETFNGTAWVAVTGGQSIVYNDMTASGDLWASPVWASPATDSQNMIASVRAYIDGVVYFAEGAREVTGQFNDHRKPLLQWLGLP